MYRKILPLFLLLLALGTAEVSAQGFLKNLKKKAEQVVNRARENQRSKEQPESEKRPAPKKAAPARTASKTPAQTAPKRAKLTPPPATSTALFEPIGYPTANGTVERAITLPQSSETKQREWVRAQPAIEKLTNKSLAEEYKALDAWEAKATFTITEALDVRRLKVNEELGRRANALGSFVKELQAARKEKPGEPDWAREQRITAFARVLESNEYKRAIHSSLVPLKPYLTADALNYFAANGGLEKALVGEKTKWQPAPTETVSTSEGMTGTVTLDGMVDVGGLVFRIYPTENRAVLSKTHAEAIAGKEIVIPSHIQKDGKSYPVRYISPGTFYSNAIRSISIPNTVTKIGNNAFANLIHVTKIEIPASVTELEAACFHSSPELQEVHVPSSVKRIGGGCFADCPKLTTVTLPPVVSHFDIGQFSMCPSLVQVTLPGNLKKIGNAMFKGCKSLTTVTIPESVTVIEGGAFEGCSKLASIVIPPSVTEIGDGAFAGCSALTSIVIPPSVTKINHGAFSGCTALKSVVISSAFAEYNQLRQIFDHKIFTPEKSDILSRFTFTESAASTAKATAPSRDYIDERGVNHGQGIAIGNVVWAPVNCGYHPTEYPWGKLYQWGRKQGQGYGTPYHNPADANKPDPVPASIATGPTTAKEASGHPETFYTGSSRLDDWRSTPNDAAWNGGTEDAPKKTANDPCPEGWRIPTRKELGTLGRTIPGTGDAQQKGCWCYGAASTDQAKAKLFLPAAGIRLANGKAYNRNETGGYWSSQANNRLAYYLCVTKVSTGTSPLQRAAGASVRCVQE